MEQTFNLSKKKKIPVEGALTLKCVYHYCVQSCVFYASNPVSSICNQSIPIYLSIGIDNQYQSINQLLVSIGID